MTATLSQPAADERSVPPLIKRWWFLPVVGVGILASMIILAVAVLAFRMWHGRQLAVRAVAAEVARIRAAGEPITTEDLYAFHRVKSSTRDNTAAWLDALASFDETQLLASGKALPVVGDERDITLLRPAATNSQFAAAESFLKEFEPALAKIHAAALLEGECRFPIQFEKGLHAQVPHAQKMRTAARLLALEARTRAYAGDADGAIRSTFDILSAGDALAHQPNLIEQLVRIACLTMALQEIEFLLSEQQLTPAQLGAIDQRLAALDPQSGLTLAMLGERGMNFHTFHHLSSLSQEVEGIEQISLGAADGQLARPMDCQKSLELLADAIEASRQPFPAAREDMEQMENRLRRMVGSRNPLDRLNYLVSAMLLPATGAAFDATARTMARRDALVAAIAAERYRVETGSFPIQLADLVPKYLPAVPVDPYDGKPLGMLATSGEVVVYSVGKDGKGDQGLENEHRAEPDIAIRVQAGKAGQESAQP